MKVDRSKLKKTPTEAVSMLNVSCLMIVADNDCIANNVMFEILTGMHAHCISISSHFLWLTNSSFQMIQTKEDLDIKVLSFVTVGSYFYG